MTTRPTGLRRGRTPPDAAGELRKIMLLRLEYDLTTWSDRRNVSYQCGPDEAVRRGRVARGYPADLPDNH